MKVFLILLCLLKLQAAHLNGFPNLTRGFFSYNDYSVAPVSQDKCTLCATPFWQSVSQIIDYSVYENTKEYILSVDKRESVDKLGACKKCMAKLDLYNLIESKMVDSSLTSTYLENLNYLEILDGEINSYITLSVGKSLFMIAINNNTTETVENVIFLIPLTKVDAPITVYSPDNSKDIERLITKEYDSEAELGYIAVTNFIAGELKVSSKILKELQKGKSHFTAKNIGYAILTYYILGSIAVLMYFGLSKREPKYA